MALLDRANNLLGPLDNGLKERIMKYVENPNPTSMDWREIHSVIINNAAKHGRPQTVWQAVTAIDPTFPTCAPSNQEWTRVPNPMLVARAIRAATEES